MNFDIFNFLTEVVACTGGNLTSTAINATLKKLFSSKPELENRLTNPSSLEDFQKTLSELQGVIEALAGTGEISINNAILSALRSARFDHQNGIIQIGNTQISAPILHTGGTGQGCTVISGNTELRSGGTSMKIGYGASLVITGNATMKQT